MSPFSFCCWPIVVSNLAGPPPSRLSIGPSDPPAGNHANARARPRLSPPRRPPAALCTLWWESFRCSMEIRTTGKLVKSGLDEFDGRGGGRLWREEVRACPWARHRLTSPTSRTHDTSERCCAPPICYKLQWITASVKRRVSTHQSHRCPAVLATRTNPSPGAPS